MGPNFMGDVAWEHLAGLVTVVATVGGAVWVLAKFLVSNQTHAVMDGELKRLNTSINDLAQTIMKLSLKIDNLIRNQDEQSRAIERHDKSIDDHTERIARLEEHIKGD